VTETTKAFTDYFGNFGYAFAQVEAGPRSTAPTTAWPSCWRPTLAPRLRAPHQRGRQQPHARRSDPPRVPPVRVELVRRRQDQAVARPRRPPELLQGRERRDQRRAGRARPGRPERHRDRAPTGSLQLGAGFSSAEKLALSFSIKQENAFGSGNYLGVEVNTSKYNRTLAFNTVNPYFTPDGISRTIDVYHRSSRPYDDQGGNYQLVTSGAACASACRSASSTPCSSAPASSAPRSSPGTNIPAAYLAYAEQFGYTSIRCRCRSAGRATTATARWRPPRPLPALSGELGRGRRHPLPARQLPVPAVRAAEQAVHAGLQRRTGLRQGPAGRPFPVFKNFYSGGLGSVRGFEQGTLGPRDVTGSSDRRRPQEADPEHRGDHAVPGRRQRPHLRMFGFVDVGNVYGENEKFSLRTCAPRPASACPGCRRSARCASLSPSRCASSLAIESRNCNSRSEPPSDEASVPSLPFPAGRAGPGAPGAGGGFPRGLRQHRPHLPRGELRQAAQAKLEQEFSKREKELNDLGTALKTAPPTSSSARRPRWPKASAGSGKSLIDQDREFQRKRREFQEDLNARKNEELQQVLDRANRVVKQVAEQEKYDLILQEAVYINPKHDITDKVIKALNAVV
jgi:Skp family chaperone for outer membrane proteins